VKVGREASERLLKLLETRPAPGPGKKP
jgi:hypothetical protein